MLNNSSVADIGQDTTAKTEAKIGEVTRVYTRAEEGEGNVEVNVQTRSRSNEFRRKPVVAFDHTGHVVVPEVGDHVLVEHVVGESSPVVVTDVIPNKQTPSPLARPGHWRHEWGTGTDRLYLEAEPSDHSGGTPDTVRMGVKPDGLSDASTEVAVDNSGSNTQVTIQTDGDITLQADGDIVIEQNGTPEPVLTESAEFEYDDTTVSDTSDGSGSSSTTTKTTGTVSNNATTDTQIN